MRTATCSLKSRSPYSQSKYIQVERKNGELHKDYEERTWRERCNSNPEGNIVIPPMCFANCVKEAAKYLSISIPGEGKAKFTKNFEAGIMVTEPITLPIKKEQVQGEWLHVPSDGKRGGTKRVLKCFPVIPNWEGDVVFHIFDDKITKEVFRQVLTAAGELIGVGRFRPRNCGFYGRFKVEAIKWAEQ